MIRLLGYFFGIGAVAFLIVAGGLAWYVEKTAEDLPDYAVLANYEPPVMTRVHATDGSLMAEYAKQRRLFLPIQAIPDLVKNAFLSAEDKNFYNHPGVDVEGIARAVVVLAKGGRMQGGSTITQQVAKNFLLTNERTFDRKIKEAIPVAAHRAGLFEGQDPRALPQRDLSRHGIIRHRGGLAGLFRQAGQRADD